MSDDTGPERQDVQASSGTGPPVFVQRILASIDHDIFEVRHRAAKNLLSKLESGLMRPEDLDDGHSMLVLRRALLSSASLNEDLWDPKANDFLAKVLSILCHVAGVKAFSELDTSEISTLLRRHLRSEFPEDVKLAGQVLAAFQSEEGRSYRSTDSLGRNHTVGSHEEDSLRGSEEFPQPSPQRIPISSRSSLQSRYQSSSSSGLRGHDQTLGSREEDSFPESAGFSLPSSQKRATTSPRSSLQNRVHSGLAGGPRGKWETDQDSLSYSEGTRDSLSSPLPRGSASSASSYHGNRSARGSECDVPTAGRADESSEPSPVKTFREGGTLYSEGWQFPAVLLTDSDEDRLLEFSLQLKSCSTSSDVLSACEKFEELFMSFPAEVFLQRPEIPIFFVQQLSAPRDTVDLDPETLMDPLLTIIGVLDSFIQQLVHKSFAIACDLSLHENARNEDINEGYSTPLKYSYPPALFPRDSRLRILRGAESYLPRSLSLSGFAMLFITGLIPTFKGGRSASKLAALRLMRLLLAVVFELENTNSKEAKSTCQLLSRDRAGEITKLWEQIIIDVQRKNVTLLSTLRGSTLQSLGDRSKLLEASNQWTHFADVYDHYEWQQFIVVTIQILRVILQFGAASGDSLSSIYRHLISEVLTSGVMKALTPDDQKLIEDLAQIHCPSLLEDYRALEAIKAGVEALGILVSHEESSKYSEALHDHCSEVRLFQLTEQLLPKAMAASEQSLSIRHLQDPKVVAGLWKLVAISCHVACRLRAFGKREVLNELSITLNGLIPELLAAGGIGASSVTKSIVGGLCASLTQEEAQLLALQSLDPDRDFGAIREFISYNPSLVHGLLLEALHNGALQDFLGIKLLQLLDSVEPQVFSHLYSDQDGFEQVNSWQIASCYHMLKSRHFASSSQSSPVDLSNGLALNLKELVKAKSPALEITFSLRELFHTNEKVRRAASNSLFSLLPERYRPWVSYASDPMDIQPDAALDISAPQMFMEDGQLYEQEFEVLLTLLASPNLTWQIRGSIFQQISEILASDSQMRQKIQGSDLPVQIVGSCLNLLEDSLAAEGDFAGTEKQHLRNAIAWVAVTLKVLLRFSDTAREAIVQSFDTLAEPGDSKFPPSLLPLIFHFNEGKRHSEVHEDAVVVCVPAFLDSCGFNLHKVQGLSMKVTTNPQQRKYPVGEAKAPTGSGMVQAPSSAGKPDSMPSEILRARHEDLPHIFLKRVLEELRRVTSHRKFIHYIHIAKEATTDLSDQGNSDCQDLTGMTTETFSRFFKHRPGSLRDFGVLMALLEYLLVVPELGPELTDVLLEFTSILGLVSNDDFETLRPYKQKGNVQTGDGGKTITAVVFVKRRVLALALQAWCRIVALDACPLSTLERFLDQSAFIATLGTIIAEEDDPALSGHIMKLAGHLLQKAPKLTGASLAILTSNVFRWALGSASNLHRVGDSFQGKWHVREALKALSVSATALPLQKPGLWVLNGNFHWVLRAFKDREAAIRTAGLSIVLALRNSSHIQELPWTHLLERLKSPRYCAMERALCGSLLLEVVRNEKEAEGFLKTSLELVAKQPVRLLTQRTATANSISAILKIIQYSHASIGDADFFSSAQDRLQLLRLLLKLSHPLYYSDLLRITISENVPSGAALSMEVAMVPRCKLISAWKGKLELFNYRAAYQASGSALELLSRLITTGDESSLTEVTSNSYFRAGIVEIFESSRILPEAERIMAVGSAVRTLSAVLKKYPASKALTTSRLAFSLSEEDVYTLMSSVGCFLGSDYPLWSRIELCRHLSELLTTCDCAGRINSKGLAGNFVYILKEIWTGGRAFAKKGDPGTAHDIVILCLCCVLPSSEERTTEALRAGLGEIIFQGLKEIGDQVAASHGNSCGEEGLAYLDALVQLLLAISATRSVAVQDYMRLQEVQKIWMKLLSRVSKDFFHHHNRSGEKERDDSVQKRNSSLLVNLLNVLANFIYDNPRSRSALLDRIQTSDDVTQGKSTILAWLLRLSEKLLSLKHEASLRSSLAVLQSASLSPDCNSAIIRSGYPQSCLKALEDLLAQKRRKLGIILGLSQVLTSLALSEEGQRLLIKCSGIKNILLDLLSASEEQVVKQGLLLMHNLAFYRAFKSQTTVWDSLLPKILELLSSKWLAIRPIAAAAMWAFAYNNMKASSYLASHDASAKLCQAEELIKQELTMGDPNNDAAQILKEALRTIALVTHCAMRQGSNASSLDTPVPQ